MTWPLLPLHWAALRPCLGQLYDKRVLRCANIVPQLVLGSTRTQPAQALAPTRLLSPHLPSVFHGSLLPVSALFPSGFLKV